jgi:hypothetical protein
MTLEEILVSCILVVEILDFAFTRWEFRQKQPKKARKNARRQARVDDGTFEELI